MTNDGKRCRVCKQTLALSAFIKDRGGRLRSECRACKSLAARAKYDAEARTRASQRHRHRTYGLAPDQFHELLFSQDGQCAICQDPLKLGKNTHVDHCHKSDRVRAILCHPCNMLVGHIEARPDVVLAAMSYVQRHQEITASIETQEIETQENADAEDLRLAAEIAACYIPTD
jgi:hypothetical protein